MFAKLLGVKVERFSIGLGPSLWSRKYGETEYILAAIPFGGYIKMLGEHTSLEDMGQEDVVPPSEEELRRSFDRQPVWKRSTIILMGPLFNIILAFLVLLVFFSVYGESVRLPQIGGVLSNSPAVTAGLRGGDVIVSIDGKDMESWSEVQEAIRVKSGDEIGFVIRRDSEEFSLRIRPELRKTKTLLLDEIEVYLVGIEPSDKVRYEKVGFRRAVLDAAGTTVTMGRLIFEVMVRLVKRIIPADTLGGPIMIFKMAGDQASKGMADYLWLMAFISVNLGVLNLLPIPVLDGGHLVFMGIEAVRRKPLSEKVIENAQKVGIALLLTLMVFATYNDIVRWITGKWTP
jgi:regulator of sigma E protease